MKALVYSAQDFEKEPILAANNNKHDIRFADVSLNEDTAGLTSGVEAVVIFVNDDASAKVIAKLASFGVKNIALRSAGYNNVDIICAKELGIRVARVPAYSPFAVAEHAVALMLALNRKLIRANNRVHELNFSLNGLTGFDMNGKTAGIAGTGKIGQCMARILHGFGCRILAYDRYEDHSLKETYAVKYTTREQLFAESDIISLHLPLLPETKYFVNAESIKQMKTGVMLINTSRGALIQTKDVIQGLKSGKIGYLGLDVYEEEAKLFFYDHSEDILQDDVISRLLTFKNVLVTSHQGFLTDTALKNIADSTVYNLDCFDMGTHCINEI